MLRASTKRRRLRAAIGGLLGALLVASTATFALAQQEDDDEETFEQGIIKNILGGLGAETGRRAGIDYRERSPLVIPPSADLPVPEQTAAAPSAAWPKDPDLKVNQPKKKKKTAATSHGFRGEDAPLMPDELRRGAAAGAGRITSPGDTGSKSEGEIDRALRPNELGYKGGIFSSLFGSTKEEQTVFTGEPQRGSLTEPPSGYRTPSGAQPYGVGVNREKRDGVGEILKDRVTGR